MQRVGYILNKEICKEFQRIQRILLVSNCKILQSFSMKERHQFKVISSTVFW